MGWPLERSHHWHSVAPRSIFFAVPLARWTSVFSQLVGLPQERIYVAASLESRVSNIEQRFVIITLKIGIRGYALSAGHGGILGLQRRLGNGCEKVLVG